MDLTAWSVVGGMNGGVARAGIGGPFRFGGGTLNISGCVSRYIWYSSCRLTYSKEALSLTRGNVTDTDTVKTHLDKFERSTTDAYYSATGCTSDQARYRYISN
jgi:hypothetical protein